ncbi:MAG: hypothetical protein AB8B55_14420 [Mariniblastus sp.]
MHPVFEKATENVTDDSTTLAALKAFAFSNAELETDLEWNRSIDEAWLAASQVD